MLNFLKYEVASLLLKPFICSYIKRDAWLMLITEEIYNIQFKGKNRGNEEQC